MSTKQKQTLSGLPEETVQKAFEQALFLSALTLLGHVKEIKEEIVRKKTYPTETEQIVLSAMKHQPPNEASWLEGFFYEDIDMDYLQGLSLRQLRNFVEDQILCIESEYLVADNEKLTGLLCKMSGLMQYRNMLCSVESKTLSPERSLRHQKLSFSEGFSEKAKQLLQDRFSTWMLSTEIFFYRFLSQNVVLQEELPHFFEYLPGATAVLSVEAILPKEMTMLPTPRREHH